jgi:lactoylglutathione lyase
LKGAAKEMNFSIAHTNINVLDLEKSLAFYREALGLEVIRRKKAADESFELAFIGKDSNAHLIELTWLRDRKTPYNLGDNEWHIAFIAEDIKAAHELHEKMGCICYENPAMGIYFIADPDGYWLEICPLKK